MLRRLFIFGYKLFFRFWFVIFSMFPLKGKVCFVASFGDNVQFLLDEFENRGSQYRVVVLQSRECPVLMTNSEYIVKYRFETFNLIHEIRNVYHLATSKTVCVDNYFGFLSFIKFRKGVECIQLWHAAGSFKKFGLLNPSNENRTTSDKKRFQKVYDNFHKAIVGSDEHANVYYEAFNLKESNILRLGIPRSDIFFDMKKAEAVKHSIRDKFGISDKKVILYAPTFRNDEYMELKCPLDIQMLRDNFSETHVLLVRAHRNFYFDITSNGRADTFCFWDTSGFHINDLLLEADILITDYSSIPFEYSIMKKPMIFFAYDLEEYSEKNGVLFDYVNFVPGPVAYSTKDIVDLITREDFDFQKIKDFHLKWNTYMNGDSSCKVVDYIINRDS